MFAKLLEFRIVYYGSITQHILTDTKTGTNSQGNTNNQSKYNKPKLALKRQ